MLEPVTVVMVAVAASSGAGVVVAGAKAMKIGAEIYRERQQAVGSALKRAYRDVLAEGTPAEFTELLSKLGASNEQRN